MHLDISQRIYCRLINPDRMRWRGANLIDIENKSYSNSDDFSSVALQHIKLSRSVTRAKDALRYTALSAGRSGERGGNRLAHRSRTDRLQPGLGDIGGAQTLIQHTFDGGLDPIGEITTIQRVAQQHRQR